MNLPAFTLLIVEDLPANREVYRQCLTDDLSCDYDLLEAASVAEGLELCRTRSIDAILLDYLLPDGDGLGFLEVLSAQSQTSRPPVVMMTGYGNESIAVRAMKLGAADYLVKSKFTPELLCSTMQGAIENERLRLQLWQQERQFSADNLDDGFGASWSDVATHTQVELASTRAAQERDRLFDLSCDLLAIGNFDGYFTQINPAFEQVLGFSDAELMVRPFIDFVHPEDRQHTLAATQSLTVGAVVTDFENRCLCQDGSYRWVSWNATPCAHGNVWYGVGRDITDRQHTQAQLEQRNQELDSFVHIVSHDLKAPLRAVANLSKWIEEDLEDTLTAATRRQMELLRGRVDRMSATIDGLLDYARIGRTTEAIELVAIAQLLAETIETLAPPPTFTIAIAHNLPKIQTKRMRLSQVFTNLVGNAIKHHDRADGLIHLGIAERPEFYEFAVSDDGPGISPEQHERVFEIFHAVNPQNRPDSTGIGLAIVKKIVEAEGGTIRLESQLGKGTTFYFTWPKSLPK